MTALSTRTAASLSPDRPAYGQVRRRTDASHWLVLLAVAVLVIGPLVPVVVQAFATRALHEGLGSVTAANFVSLFQEAGFGTVIVNSLILAGVTTIVTLVAAALLAILVVRTPVRGANVLHHLILMPLYISSMIIGFGAISIYGPQGYVTVLVRRLVGQNPWNLYSLSGMALVEAVVMVPLAYLYCSATLRQADSSQEDAARICGAGSRTILWRVVLPTLRPPLLYAGVLIFTASLESLSVPLLFGVPAHIETFGTFLYHRGLTQTNPDYGQLGAAALLMLGLLLVLLVVQGFALKNAGRFVSVRGKAVRKRPLHLGWLALPAWLVAVGFVVFGIGLPLAGVVARAFTTVLTPLVSPWKVLTTRNFEELFAVPQYTASILNSVVIALVGAVLTTAFMLVVVLVVRRSAFRHGRALELISLAPQAIPGIIIGLGVFWALASLGPLGMIRSSIVVLVLAFSLRAFPTAFSSLSPSVLQIGPEIDAAARISGAGWWTAMFRVLRGLLGPALLSSFVLLFVGMLKEYTPAVFLATPGTEIIGTTMLSLWAGGDAGRVAALSCIQLLLTAVVVILASRLLKVRTHA